MATQSEPKRRHRPVIRVFVSSTFSDLKHERNALAAKVWPHLEKYCQQRGFTFQAIDLRWGVPSEAGLDHRTMQICFEEIRRAQETSPQPNFLILLGNRYGWRPLPEVVCVEEFVKLQSAAEDIQAAPRQLFPNASDAQIALLRKSVAVLEYWYRLDTNARPFGSKLPGEHVLRTRKPAELGDKSRDPLADNPQQPVDYGRPPGPDGTKEDTQAWKDVQYVLWSIVNRAFPAIDLAGRFKQLTTNRNPPSIVRFQASATEQEIWRGAFEVEPAHVKEHVIAWFRTIEGPLPDSTNRRLKDFIDLQEDGHTPDKIASDALDKLRSQVAEQLGKENIGEGTCRWASNGDAETAPDVTTNHLDQMCVDIRSRLEAMVLTQISDYWGVDEEKMSAPDASMALVRGSKRELELECEDHERFARERVPEGTFVGREQELQRLRDYLHSDTNQPYVVHGPSGSGKSALLGKIVQEVTPAKEADVSNSKFGPIVLSRFLGTTPESSTLRGLLTSLCRELRQHFTVTASRKSPDGNEETDTPSIPVDINELIEEFYTQLGKATTQRPIYVFLDAIDQLDSADGGRAAYWVRSPILWDRREQPCHARLVVSCLSPSDDFPKDSEACESYREFEARDLISGPELGSLDPAAAVDLIHSWLASAGRSLTDDQHTSVTEVLQRPTACRQPLYLQVLFEEFRRWKSIDPVPAIPETLPLILNDMFERLGRSTEHDILPQIALSLIVSARYGLSESELLEILFGDPKYKPYLDKMNQDNRHELPDKATRVPIAPWARLRSDLGPYLAERAAPGTAVLHFYHRQVERAAMVSLLPAPTGRRHQQEQLAAFFDDRWPSGDAHALMELPRLLLESADHSRLLDLLCNLDFPQCKTNAGFVTDLVEDCLVLRKQCNPPELERFDPWYYFVRKNAAFLHDYPDSFFQQAYNEASESPVSQAAQLRWSLAVETDPIGNPSSIAAEHAKQDQPRTVPDAFLEWTNREKEWHPPVCLMTLCGDRNEIGEVHRVIISQDETTIVAIAGGYRKVLVWDAHTGICRHTLKGESCIDISADSSTIVTALEYSVRVWDARMGNCRHVLDGHSSWVKCVVLSTDGNTVFSGSDDHTVRIWDTRSGVCRHILEGHTDSISCLVVSDDGNTIVSGSYDHTLRLWDARTGTCRQILKGHTRWVISVFLSCDGTTIVSGSDDNTVRLWDALTGKCRHKLEGHIDRVNTVLLSTDCGTVVSGSCDNTVRVWDAQTGTCRHTLEAHACSARHQAQNNSILAVFSHYRARALRFCSELASLFTPVHNHNPDPETSKTKQRNQAEDILPMAAAIGKTITVWNCITGELIGNLRGHTDDVSCVSVSSKSRRRIVSGSKLHDGSVRLWEVRIANATSIPYEHIDTVIDVFVNKCRTKVVTGSVDTTVRIWDVQEQRCCKTLRGHLAPVTRVHLSEE